MKTKCVCLRALRLFAGAFALLSAAKTQAAVIAYQKVVTSVDKSINENPGYQKVVVCSAGPFTVLAGDLATAHMQQEVTWTGSGRIATACGIVVATSPTAVDNTSTGYIGMLSKFSGSNLLKTQEANETLTRTGSYKFAADYTTVYINSVAYGQTLPLNTPGPNAIIPASYAEIVAAIERGVSRYSTTAYQPTPHGMPFDSTEGNYYVPVTASTFDPKVQYSYGPLNIPANSMVDVRFQVEASTPTGATVTQRLGRKVIQTTAANSTSGNLLNLAIQGGGTNLEHHMTFGSGGGMYFPSAVNNAYFNSVLWGYGTGTKLLVESESSVLYGGFAVEVRPYVGYWRDNTRNAVNIDATQRIMYIVGPIDVPADQLVEIRYQAAFQPSSNVGFDSKIVRGTSATDALGTELQRPLYRKFDPSSVYTNAIHSTAERLTTALTGQYYKVIGWLPSGGTLPMLDWGHLEVIFR